MRWTHSSVGQSSGLIIRRSWDHAPLGPLFWAVTKGCSRLFCAHKDWSVGAKKWPKNLVPLTKVNIFVYFVGALLAGADGVTEGSGGGVATLSALCVAEKILE